MVAGRLGRRQVAGWVASWVAGWSGSGRVGRWWVGEWYLPNVAEHPDDAQHPRDAEEPYGSHRPPCLKPCQRRRLCDHIADRGHQKHEVEPTPTPISAEKEAPPGFDKPHEQLDDVPDVERQGEMRVHLRRLTCGRGSLLDGALSRPARFCRAQCFLPRPQRFALVKRAWKTGCVACWERSPAHNAVGSFRCYAMCPWSGALLGLCMSSSRRGHNSIECSFLRRGSVMRCIHDCARPSGLSTIVKWPNAPPSNCP